MRVLITGVDGFTGRYVADAFKRDGVAVCGISHSTRKGAEADSIFQGDLLNRDRLVEIVATVQPDYVVHLAAIAYVPYGKVEDIYQTNVQGTRNLLQAILDAGVVPKGVLLASSANVYGNAAVEIINETVAAAPTNDYAVSKLAMEYVARLFFDRLPIVLVRPFNYTGVGQANNFLLPKIVAHFQQRAPVIELGNLDIARDFSDVRTVADCYRRLLSKSSAIGGIFNVCSGKAYSLLDVLRIAESITGHAMEVRVNPALVRANDVKVLKGDRARLASVIGHIEDYFLEDTLRWMLDNQTAI